MNLLDICNGYIFFYKNHDVNWKMYLSLEPANILLFDKTELYFQRQLSLLIGLPLRWRQSWLSWWLPNDSNKTETFPSFHEHTVTEGETPWKTETLPLLLSHEHGMHGGECMALNAWCCVLDVWHQHIALECSPWSSLWWPHHPSRLKSSKAQACLC